MFHIPGRYSDNLDSTRFRKETAPKIENTATAFFEILISILFGNRIILTENQLFDSKGFLDAARVLLEVWEQERGSLIDTPLAFPFGVAYRKDEPNNHVDFRHTLKSLFGKTYDSEQTFALSAWPEIDEENAIRKDLAKLFAEGKFNEAGKKYPIIDPGKIYSLELIDNYSNLAPVDFQQNITESARPMDLSLGAVLDLSENDIDSMAETEAEIAKTIEISSPIIGPSIDELKGLIVELKRLRKGKNKLALNYRSQLYKKDFIDENDIDDDILLGLRELYNSCYNAANASTAKSNIASISKESEGKWADAGFALASYGVGDNFLTSDKGKVETPFYQSQEIRLENISEESYKKIFGLGADSEIIKREIVKKVFQIISKKRWADSVSSLLEAYSSGEEAMVDEKFYEHSKLLSDELIGGPFSFEEGENRIIAKWTIGGAIAGGGGMILTAALSDPNIMVSVIGGLVSISAGVLPTIAGRRKIYQRKASVRSEFKKLKLK